MNMFRHIFAPALLLAALFCFPACDGHGNDVREGTGTVIVNISNPVELETRHTEGEGSDASDGGIMKTLSVWLITDGAANGDNKYTISKRFLGTPDAATATVTFEDVARGNYYLVATANYDQTTMIAADYKEGGSVVEDFTASFVKVSPTSTSSALSDGQSPTFDDAYGMPSSYEQTFSVAAGENVIEAHLRRCVGRLTFNVRNNLDDYDLYIHSIGLLKRNKSKGYVFESENTEENLTAVEYVNFPDLPAMGGLVKVGARAYNNIYDIYLFDTGAGANFTFDMIAALYPKDTPAESVKVSTQAQSTYVIQGRIPDFSSGGQYMYMICSGNNSNIYLGDTGTSGNGTLAATELTSDDEIAALSNITAYFWKFSSSTGNSTTIQNVATGNYLTISVSNGTGSVSLSSSSSDISTAYDTSGDYCRFYVKSSNKDYYISYEGSISIKTKKNGNATKWSVRPIKPGTSGGTTIVFDNPELDVVNIPRNDRPIKYLDKYGASQPLTQISRNEHVTVSINVFYNREIGEFQFEVLDWDDGKSHETTFD